jgi:hypothetical protein
MRLLITYGRPQTFETPPRADSGATTITVAFILGLLWR